MFCKYKLKEPKIASQKLFKTAKTILFFKANMKPFQISFFYSIMQSKKALWAVKTKQQKLWFHAYHKRIFERMVKTTAQARIKHTCNCKLINYLDNIIIVLAKS